jgi:hypothetical protein
MAECFLALLSSFSSDSARSTVSPYPWSMSDFCRGSLHDILHKATIIIEYSSLAEIDYSRVLSRTFCWREICTLRQTHSKPNKLASHANKFQSVPVNFPWKLTKRQSG